MVKTVVFDLDDTLLNDRRSILEALRATCQQAASAYNINASELLERVRINAPKVYQTLKSYEFTKQIGINPFEGLWGSFTDVHHHGFRQMRAEVPAYQQFVWKRSLEDLEVSSPNAKFWADTFKAHRRRLPWLFDEAIDTLHDLSQDYQLLLLTNGAPSLQQEKLTMSPILIPYFDHIVISGAFGWGKPEPALFQHTVKLAGVNPEDAVMVGDNLNTDITGASLSGLSSVWLNLRKQEQPTAPVPTKQIYTIGELPEVVRELD
ncbi:putative hydrolase of the HAD superfamily [Salsuginibacillus halophilus]|uniref:Phosphoserine phosphatase n=1 Tax=Salsuginibacillus halophilus TaxID=517424 RepID=A0A2P8HWS6_9BACI|nr:HAD family hydrolase [Salsuginibacillus halophilus]PSL50605.1 putative hydrolase of the HAD superfamily [Salsuginibacillus halophilus]